MGRRGALIVLLAGLAGPALAGDPAPVPGDERAVTRHYSHDELAAGLLSEEELIAHGRLLFDARFTTLDGAGRPLATGADVPTHRPASDTPAFFRTSGPEANSCGGCHFQPVLGGAGDFVANVFVAPQDIEYDFDTIVPDLSMERGTTPIQGAGLLELLAREMTADLHALRDDAVAAARATEVEVRVPLTTKGVSFGFLTARPDGFLEMREVEGIHHDLIVKPFSQKAVVISLRQFSDTAFNVHHGMQPAERFGPRWTGVEDFDGDDHLRELTDGDITAATIWQATRPPPTRILPAEPVLREAAMRGEDLFTDIGCGSCHRPYLPLDNPVFTEPGPYNPAGTLRPEDAEGLVSVDLAARFGDLLQRLPDGRWAVRAFTDLKRHRIADAERPFFANELITHNFVPRDQFRTAPLWGVGSTAPYGHRGDVTTLAEVIGHHGGDATEARRAFEALPPADRGAIVEFLKTLRIPETPPIAASSTRQRAEAPR